MGDALWPGLDDLYVCLVVRKSGLESFPKDIAKRKKSLILTALEVWSTTTGITPGRVTPQTCLHVDDEKHGCRYLVTKFDWPGRSSRSKQPDSDELG